MTNLRALLANNIKKRREILGVSQAVLAEKVGTSTHYIGQIETCKKFPSSEMLERIAIALEFDTPDLFSKGPYTIEALKQFREGIIADIATVSKSLVAVNKSLDKRLDKLLTSKK